MRGAARGGWPSPAGRTPGAPLGPAGAERGAGKGLREATSPGGDAGKLPVRPVT